MPVSWYGPLQAGRRRAEEVALHLAGERASGRLAVMRGDLLCELYFEEGVLVHLEAREQVGWAFGPLDARAGDMLRDVLGWQEGFYGFEPGAQSQAHTHQLRLGAATEPPPAVPGPPPAAMNSQVGAARGGFAGSVEASATQPSSATPQDFAVWNNVLRQLATHLDEQYGAGTFRAAWAQARAVLTQEFPTVAALRPLTGSGRGAFELEQPVKVEGDTLAALLQVTWWLAGRYDLKPPELRAIVLSSSAGTSGGAPRMAGRGGFVGRPSPESAGRYGEEELRRARVVELWS